MKPNNRLTLTTSPLSQPARKPRGTASLSHRQRFLYGGRRRYSAGKELDTETGLYYYGARYLDGRTGRWLSGDPAVGDYVPEAPADGGARKRNGSLPGMGGVFNYVNLHVYHYAGNNPMRYVDPDGERSIFFWEKISITAILGKGLGKIIKKIDLNMSQATRQQIEAGGAGYHSFTADEIDIMFNNNPNIGRWGISLPNGSIYISKDARGGSIPKMKAVLIHEVFHQLQYADSTRTTADSFQALVGEMNMPGDPYDYTLENVTTLQNMSTFESQAQLVEDFANGYYAGKRFFGKDKFDQQTIDRAQILRNSGINSRAINRVLDSQNQ